MPPADGAGAERHQGDGVDARNDDAFGGAVGVPLQQNRRPAQVSDTCVATDGDVEIPVAVSDLVASWQRVFAARKDHVDPHDLLQKAAVDLFEILDTNRTVYPNSAAVAQQFTVDTLQQMAGSSGIAPDDAQHIFANAREGTKPQRNNQLPALPWLDMANWDNEPAPERQWAIKDRVPLNQAGLLSGEGGTGKSIIELMKDVAHVAGKDWLHSLPEAGPAFYLGAEDDKDEIHIRLAAIAKHYGVTFRELIDGGLHVLCLLGQDATLCATNPRTGRVETTPLYKQIYEAAGDVKPKNISVDTLSRAFAGSEIDRVQVYSFASHMQALAMVAGGSVTILSHPSLAGIQSGSGYSGSTAWHGAFRFRQYLKGLKAEAGEQPDNDLRVIEFKKNQYGPIGETIALRYQRGLFLPEHGMSTIERAAREATVEDTFITVGKKLETRGQELSPAQQSHNYAPTLVANQPEAKGIKKAEFVAALDRLLDAGKVHIATVKPGTSREKKVIKVKLSEGMSA
jgi:RecA-family ATPase